MSDSIAAGTSGFFTTTVPPKPTAHGPRRETFDLGLQQDPLGATTATYPRNASVLLDEGQRLRTVADVNVQLAAAGLRERDVDANATRGR